MIALITGASRGIGKSIADKFAQNGYTLLLVSKTEQKVQEAAKDILTKNPKALVYTKACDVAHQQNVDQLCQWVLAIGVPTVVVNNAGAFEPGKIITEPNGLLERQLAVNLFSAYYLTRGLVAAMVNRGSGHIFNICSIASLQAYDNGGAYSISKYALHGFTKNLRMELMDKNIKVTGVYPGAVFTDSWAGFDNSQARIMEATDVAEMVYAAARLSPQACVEDIILRPQLGDL